MRGIVSFLLLLLIISCANHTDRPQARDGVLDLRSVDLKADETLDMAGEWEFYWQQLLTPDNVEGAASSRILMPVPGIWNQTKEQFPAIGYATYRLKVLCHPGDEIAILFPGIWSASRIFVNGKQILEMGRVSDRAEQEIPKVGRHLYALRAETSSFDIVIQASNFQIFLAGLTDVPQIGTLATVTRERDMILSLDVFAAGALFIMGIYNLCLHALRRKEKSTLWFGLVCLAGSSWMSSSRMGVILLFWPELSFDLRLRIYNSSWIFAAVAFSWFSYYTLRGLFSRKLCLAISLYASLSLLILLITPPSLFVSVANYFQPFALVMTIYTIYFASRSFLAGKRDAGIFLIGMFVLLTTFLLDIMSIRRILILPALSGFGFLSFVFIQSYLIARRSSRAFEQAEHLSEHLQREVKSQTEKLEIQRDKLIEQKKELVEAHETLQKHDEKKTRFFQNISHELRTPLTLILGSLSQAEASLQESKPIQVASRNSKRLLRLVNQLLDFQKLAAGEGDLHLKRLDLPVFLNSLADYFRPSCEQRGIRFELQMEDSGMDRIMVKADLDSLEKIVFNYLSNALKFTPRGGCIQLQLGMVGHMARIQVEDSGPGIPKNKLDQLFKVFSQLDDSSKREFEGTGLGLALAKELAERMEGAVGVLSEEGEGSAFWVDLPLCHDESHTLDLLVIDDDPSLRQQLHDELLQRQVCETFRVVGTAKEAQTLLSRYRVHCVLAEASLPDGDGPSLLARLAQEQPHCKRILITARSRSQEIVQKAINMARIDRMFYKPLNTELFAGLKTLIEEAKIQHSAKILDLLVIDDEENVLKGIRLMLLDSDNITQIELVKDLDRARQIMRSHRIRCVLVDANLTAADGTDFLMEIAALQPDCHRIMITGESGPEILEKAINKARIDQVIYKPLQKKDVLSRIEEAIQKSPIQAPEEIEDSSTATWQPKDWLLADVQLGAAPALTAADEYQPTREESILVVDDVDDMRDLIQGVLRRQGYHVAGARNGEEAFELVQKQTFDLIITDWMMPRKTGPELLGALQKEPRLAGIPTILLTAKGDDVSKVIAAREGASAYLAKPFDEVELQSTVANLLKLKQGEKTIAALNRDITENILKRFLPPHLVNEIALGHREFIDEAKLSSVTILFADLCQFTKTSEELGPRRISTVLNQYFDAMTEIIFQEGGTIDKFIGDAVMVIFGAPEDMSPGQQVEKACRCALRMQERLQQLSEDWEKSAMPRFEMRIGIHHGPATVGMFGGAKRSDYTVIGPSVNLASRVEAAASPGDILLTAVVRDYLQDDNWEKAGSFNLKGVGDNVTLYRLKKECKKAA